MTDHGSSSLGAGFPPSLALPDSRGLACSHSLFLLARLGRQARFPLSPPAGSEPSIPAGKWASLGKAQKEGEKEAPFLFQDLSLPLLEVQDDSSDRHRGDEMTNPEKHERAASRRTSTCQRNDEGLSGKWSAFQLKKKKKPQLNRNQLKIL